MTDWAAYVGLALAGAAAAAVNVVAGGGSFLTLPLLIFLGLPPMQANATNRVGVLFQSFAAGWGFERHGLVDWRAAAWAGAPASVGAVLGTWLALHVGDAAFRRILASLMVLVTLGTLLHPTASTTVVGRRRGRGLSAAAFLLVGVYAGFVQAGVGFFILAVTSWNGLDLVRGNALKVLCVGLLTVLSLAIFASQGLVAWRQGLALGLGSLAGSEIGVRLVVGRGERFVRAAVSATVLLFALELWLR